MSSISLKNINKTFPDGTQVLPNLNLEIKDKEFIILVGPSGCGKSTTLRIIAGLEDVTKGEVYIGDRNVTAAPPKNRNIAMVFQSYALYPHMTVYKNMAFALSLKKVPKEEIKRKVMEAAKILDIEKYLDRKPRALSGGQRQRVALGRAMVRDPAVFLLDEPLSNLDAKLRGEMRAQIALLHKRLGTTFVYVTHDQTEAMTMADRIVVMKDGVINQIDTPENLYRHPINTFVAGFIGTPAINFITAVLLKDKGLSLNFEGETLPLPQKYLENERLKPFIGKKITLGIRPEHLSLIPWKEIGSNASIKAEVELSEMMGAEIYVYALLGNQKIRAKIPSDIKPQSGSSIELYLNTDKLHLFEADSGKLICD